MRFFMDSAVKKWPNFSKLAMKWPIWQPCQKHRTHSNINCVFILELFVTSPSRLLRIMSTDFVALRLFCFNIRQHGRQILYFKDYMWTAANFIIKGRMWPYDRRLCTVALNAIRVWKWSVLCNPKFDCNFMEHVAFVFSGPNYFWLPDIHFIHFQNKIASAHRNIHSIQILCTLPKKIDF